MRYLPVLLLLLSSEALASEKCLMCKFAVELLHDAWGGKITEDYIVRLSLFICRTFKIEDHYVCRGIVDVFKDDFIYVMGQVIVEPQQICGILFKECGKFTNPFNSTWSISIPPGQPTPVDMQPVKPGMPTLRVLHLTDLHLDMLYTPGLETKCSEPQCCRPQQSPIEMSATPDVKLPAGYWGMVGNCDAPYWLLTNMLEFIQENHKDLDYIVVSGDLTSHADWDYSRDSHTAIVKNISNTIRSFLYVNQTDPDGTMTWLVKQLLDAERAGDRVHMVSHIPGGDSEALEGWALNYYNVVNRFQNVIVAQFFGHTHSEEFYVTYENPESSSTRPTSVIYSAPSVTPYSDFFPAYRIYTIDGVYHGSTYQVIDFEEWYMNLTEANANPTNPQWKQLYASINQEYGLKFQSPSEWNNMIERMRTNDTLFEKYRRNFYRRSKYDGIGDCDEACKRGWLCSARRMHHSKTLCADLGPLTERQGRNNYRRKSQAIHVTKEEIQLAVDQIKNRISVNSKV